MKSLLNPKFSALSPKASPFALFSLPSSRFSFRSNPRRIPNRLLRLNPPPCSSNNFCCTIQNRSLQTEPSPPPSGEIHVIVGPMFAGKTTSLLRRIQSETTNGSLSWLDAFTVIGASCLQLLIPKVIIVLYFDLERLFLCNAIFTGLIWSTLRSSLAEDPNRVRSWKVIGLLCQTGLAMHQRAYSLMLQEFIFWKSINLTNKLIRFIRNVAIIKSSKDTRYGLDSIVTHDGAELPCWALANLSSFKQKFGIDAYEKLDVIGIDEAQFFDDLYEFCLQAADHDGKTVIVAGLDVGYGWILHYRVHAEGVSTFTGRRSFGSVLDIIPLADSVTKLTARCEICGKRACFTLRKTQDKQIELIGGVDVYMPVCRQHYVSGQVAMEATRHVLESHKVECASHT
ncbi:hypothetical protein JHK82_023689 [Glycine max]|nr:hypothetical protein JHK85_024252 [Glycine max]KAG5011497.1 hypothetical protein JHK86_023758 [Glycine max]KAG5132501.1 hypothetical protein JHK82_023689 [Glycine max]